MDGLHRNKIIQNADKNVIVVTNEDDFINKFQVFKYVMLYYTEIDFNFRVISEYVLKRYQAVMYLTSLP